jgi:hypothetical protein
MLGLTIPAISLAGGLGAAVAVVTIVLVVGPTDRELLPAERALRLVAMAYVAGLATLGLVLGILGLTLPVGHVGSMTSGVSAAGLAAGSLGIAWAWRARPAPEGRDLTPAQRSATMTRIVIGEAAGILGFLVGVVAIFLG